MRLGGGLVYKGVPLKLGVCTPEIGGGTPEIWGRLYFGFKVPSKEGQDTHTHVVKRVSNPQKTLSSKTNVTFPKYIETTQYVISN